MNPMPKTYEKKKFKTGFYGGKFMPLHKGHEYCIRTASEQCEKVYAVLFIGGADEDEIHKNLDDEDLSVLNRNDHLTSLCKKYKNVSPVLIDVTSCRLPDGSEDWDAETPLVIDAIGKFDAVYSSEESYGEYFSRAYPWAEHVLVDPPRVVYPISGTKIRNMKDNEERKQWKIWKRALRI